MLKKRQFLGAVFFIAGAFLTLNTGSNANITGAIVGIEQISPAASSILGLALVISAMILLIQENGNQSYSNNHSSGLEDKIDAGLKSYRRKLEKLEHRKISYEKAKRGYDIKEIREVTLGEKYETGFDGKIRKVRVPLEAALKIYDFAKKRIQGRKWVELFRGAPDYALGDKYRKEKGVSIIRYFGPVKRIDHKGREIENKPETVTAVDRLVSEKGYGVKIHEIASKTGTHYDTEYLKDKIEEKNLGGSGLQRIKMQNPSETSPPGESFSHSEPLHRHIEYAQSYEALKKKKGEWKNV